MRSYHEKMLDGLNNRPWKLLKFQKNCSLVHSDGHGSKPLNITKPQNAYICTKSSLESRFIIKLTKKLKKIKCVPNLPLKLYVYTLKTEFGWCFRKWFLILDVWAIVMFYIFVKFIRSFNKSIETKCSY